MEGSGLEGGSRLERASGRSLSGNHRAETGVSPGRSGGEGVPGLLRSQAPSEKGWWVKPLAGPSARELSRGRVVWMSCRAESGPTVRRGRLGFGSESSKNPLTGFHQESDIVASVRRMGWRGQWGAVETG